MMNLASDPLDEDYNADDYADRMDALCLGITRGDLLRQWIRAISRGGCGGGLGSSHDRGGSRVGMSRVARQCRQTLGAVIDRD